MDDFVNTRTKPTSHLLHGSVRSKEPIAGLGQSRGRNGEEKLDMQNGAPALGSRLGLSSVQGCCIAIATSCSPLGEAAKRKWLTLQHEEWRLDITMDFLMVNMSAGSRNGDQSREWLLLSAGDN